jgi:hypothetical protein
MCLHPPPSDEPRKRRSVPFISFYLYLGVCLRTHVLSDFVGAVHCAGADGGTKCIVDEFVEIDLLLSGGA